MSSDPTVPWTAFAEKVRALATLSTLTPIVFNFSEVDEDQITELRRLVQEAQEQSRKPVSDIFGIPIHIFEGWGSLVGKWVTLCLRERRILKLGHVGGDQPHPVSSDFRARISGVDHAGIWIEYVGHQVWIAYSNILSAAVKLDLTGPAPEEGGPPLSRTSVPDSS